LLILVAAHRALAQAVPHFYFAAALFAKLQWRGSDFISVHFLVFFSEIFCDAQGEIGWRAI
jgi:hypothetical protein